VRRQELADLAGVSVEYCTCLEQGRASGPSREVLAAHHRQRDELHLEGIPPLEPCVHRPPPAHQDLHPRRNGKIERYQRLQRDECRETRADDSEAERRTAIGVWVPHDDYHRPHTACGDQPPASRFHTGVDNDITNYI